MWLREPPFGIVLKDLLNHEILRVRNALLGSGVDIIAVEEDEET